MTVSAKLTPEVAQAITNLRASRDWQVFLQWFGDCGSAWNQVLIDSNNVDQRAVSAGMTRSITLVMKAIEAAPQVLTQLKSNQDGT